MPLLSPVVSLGSPHRSGWIRLDDLQGASSTVPVMPTPALLAMLMFVGEPQRRATQPGLGCATPRIAVRRTRAAVGRGQFGTDRTGDDTLTRLA